MGWWRGVGPPLLFLALIGVDAFVKRAPARGSDAAHRAGHRGQATVSAQGLIRLPLAERTRLAAHEMSQTTGYFIEEKLEVFVGGKMLRFETGKIGRSADGSVLVTQGDTLVYASACSEREPQDVDFTPLRVDYFERFSAAGMTSGSYNRRDGKASDREVLVSRLIDRPLRPMLTDSWTCETQVLSWVLSYDGVHGSEPMAVCAASAAVCLSSIPIERPIAGVQVGMVDGHVVINPTRAEMTNSTLNLMIAGTEEGILMIEGAAEYLPEETLLEGLQAGHEAIKVICRALAGWSAKVGRPKRMDALKLPPPELKQLLKAEFGEVIQDSLRSGDRNADSPRLSVIQQQVLGKLGGEGSEFLTRHLKLEFKKLVKQQMALMVEREGKRVDGRTVKEIRPISIEMGLLPIPHGSVLFTRGETQALVTVTLGNRGMKQRTENIEGNDEKRFYLQYSFPPSSVGEVGRIGPPGRREIGHGNLAERALIPSIPSEEEFPYSIRVESMITESCGSSSMASACGGSLALMDAGVPVNRHIAGVAMGLLMDEQLKEPIILTDILGLEDAFGTMDFKVCGDDKGVTTFQLDIKCTGLTFELLKTALAQAREGRLHVLNVMKEACGGPRRPLKPQVPRISTVKIPPTLIGKLIGPQGRQIRSVIEEYGLQELDVSDAGVVNICSMKDESNEAAKKFIAEFCKDEQKASQTVEYKGPMPEVGTVFRDVEVKGVQSFGVFVEVLPGLQGLVHVSELNNKRIVSVEGMFSLGDRMDVKLLGINEKGQLRLSRKALMEPPAPTEAGVDASSNNSTRRPQAQRTAAPVKAAPSRPPPAAR